MKRNKLATGQARLSLMGAVAALVLVPVAGYTQTKGELPILPAAQGEAWTATALYEYYGPRDSEPYKRERTQQLICTVPGTFSMASAASAELPAEYKDKCWVGDKRAEPNREQIKFACNDGLTAEAVTRREADGGYGSKFVINVPGKGGMSLTKSFRKAAGICDVTRVFPETPVPPARPAPPKPKSANTK